MIDLKNINNIYIAHGYTDMRKSIDSCSVIVQYKMYRDPFSKSSSCSAIKRGTPFRYLNGMEMDSSCIRKNSLVKINSDGQNVMKMQLRY